MAVGNPIIPYHTSPHASIRYRTPVDRYGERMPKIISFMKACDGHVRRISLTSRPDAQIRNSSNSILVKKDINYVINLHYYVIYIIVLSILGLLE